MYVGIKWHCTIDYCVNLCLVDKILCKKNAHCFIRKLFQPNSCGGNMLLRVELKQMPGEGQTHLPKFKFLAKVCIGLHMIIELQVKNQNFRESDVQNYFNQNSSWVQSFTPLKIILNDLCFYISYTLHIYILVIMFLY